MSLPIISNTQSILGYTSGEPWQFQPLITIASGTLGVTSTTLPTGITISGTTGKLTCDGTTPAGVYVIGIQANDGSSFTAVTEFTIGIEAASSLLAGSSDTGIDLDIQVVTRAVTLRGAAAPEVGLPLIIVKQHDIGIFNARFLKGEVQLDPDPDDLKFALKDKESNALLLESDIFEAGSTGATAFYKMAVEFDDTKLDNALAEAEADDGSSFVDLNAEIQWTQTVSVGTATEQRVTTQTFIVRVERDYATNA